MSNYKSYRCSFQKFQFFSECKKWPFLLVSNVLDCPKIKILNPRLRFWPGTKSTFYFFFNETRNWFFPGNWIFYKLFLCRFDEYFFKIWLDLAFKRIVLAYFEDKKSSFLEKFSRFFFLKMANTVFHKKNPNMMSFLIVIF